jgi:hypothetical protein
MFSQFWVSVSSFNKQRTESSLQDGFKLYKILWTEIQGHDILVKPKIFTRNLKFSQQGFCF